MGPKWQVVDFERAPFMAIWEMTRSCARARCGCGKRAQSRDPWELTTEEGARVLDQTAAMGAPVFIFSGGDPLLRPDLECLVRRGRDLGLRLGAVFCSCGALTRQRMLGLRSAGIGQASFNLDAPGAAAHDAFHRADGSFSEALKGIGLAHEAGVPVQVTTALARWNFGYLEPMIGLIKTLRVAVWEIVFQIPGRGKFAESLSAEQFEEAFERFYRLGRMEPFVVKITEAPHFRRFLILKERGRRAAPRAGPCVLEKPRRINGGWGLSPQAINAGKGLLFIDHLGNVCPSPFLPILAGSVRAQSLAEIYRNAPVFRKLRAPGLLKGKCGECEFSSVCGGSRARAAAATGDYLESDSFCAYVPRHAVVAAGAL